MGHDDQVAQLHHEKNETNLKFLFSLRCTEQYWHCCDEKACQKKIMEKLKKYN
jgi:hypothetical protein